VQIAYDEDRPALANLPTLSLACYASLLASSAILYPIISAFHVNPAFAPC
jgi:hypothetical protein